MRGKECEYNGVKYNTRRDMVEALGIDYTTLLRYMKEGYSENESIRKSMNTRRKQVYHVNDMIFNSKKSMLEYYNIPSTTFNRYMKKCDSAEEAVNKSLLVVGKASYKPKYDTTVFGIKYNSTKDIVEHFGINYNTFLSKRKRDNLSTEETVRYFIGDKLNVEVLGRKFKNIMEMAKELEIAYSTLYYNMSQGNTLDEVVLKGLLRKFKGCRIGEDLYTIICNVCGKELFITSKELIWFKHSDDFCKQRELEV